MIRCPDNDVQKLYYSYHSLVQHFSAGENVSRRIVECVIKNSSQKLSYLMSELICSECSNESMFMFISLCLQKIKMTLCRPMHIY